MGAALIGLAGVVVGLIGGYFMQRQQLRYQAKDLADDRQQQIEAQRESDLRLTRLERYADFIRLSQKAGLFATSPGKTRAEASEAVLEAMRAQSALSLFAGQAVRDASHEVAEWANQRSRERYTDDDWKMDHEKRRAILDDLWVLVDRCINEMQTEIKG